MQKRERVPARPACNSATGNGRARRRGERSPSLAEGSHVGRVLGAVRVAMFLAGVTPVAAPGNWRGGKAGRRYQCAHASGAAPAVLLL